MAKQTAAFAPIVENTKAVSSMSEEVTPSHIEIALGTTNGCCITFHQRRAAIVDGKVFSEVPNRPTIRTNVMEQTITIEDPVTKKTTTISVEALVKGLNALRIRWYAEDLAAAAKLTE